MINDVTLELKNTDGIIERNLMKTKIRMKPEMKVN